MNLSWCCLIFFFFYQRQDSHCKIIKKEKLTVFLCQTFIQFFRLFYIITMIPVNYLLLFCFWTSLISRAKKVKTRNRVKEAVFVRSRSQIIRQVNLHRLHTMQSLKSLFVVIYIYVFWPTNKTIMYILLIPDLTIK